MKSEKSTAKKLVLSKKTIARLNENQMTVIKGGNAFFVQVSDDWYDPGCTSNRPLTSFEQQTTL